MLTCIFAEDYRHQLERRILSNTVEDPETGCWNWQLSKDRDGYGYMTVSRASRKNQRAHKVAWVVFNVRTVPEGMVVRHTCNNPGCCNPTHLILGTVKDNNRDRFNQGRYSRRTLTEEDVITIYKLRDAGYTNEQLQQMFGRSESAVRDIYLGKSWKHVYEKYYGGKRDDVV